jgi:hypothetical protein
MFYLFCCEDGELLVPAPDVAVAHVVEEHVDGGVDQLEQVSNDLEHLSAIEQS